ncbi:MAG: methionyl-tRNA formyltransferase, partial [Spirochaetota bacterium]
MKVLFAGTPEIAVPSLRALADSGHDIVGVLTAPDRPQGRGRSLRPSPVKELALELGVPVLDPERLGAEARRRVATLGPDVLVCFAYGKI